MHQLLGVLVALAVMATDSHAGLEWLGENSPPFGFTADVRGSMHRGDTLSMIVALGGRYPNPPLVAASLGIPAALGLLSGDTSITGPLDKVVGNYTLRFVPRAVGHFQVRGRVRIDAGGDGIDYAEFSMPVDVHADTIVVEHGKYTRVELQKDGRRFRYGSQWLVPIDTTEVPVVEWLDEGAWKRAEVIGTPRGLDLKGVNAAMPDTVRFAVAIDPRGRMREFRLLGQRPDPRVIAAGEGALKRLEFKPARMGQHEVSDCILVSIPVRGHK